MPHCIALFSGGLDSCLSIITLLRQGIRITALYFNTSLGCGLSNRQDYLQGISDKFGFDLKIIDVSDEFLGILKNPAYGYGKNMNPCVDCKMMMLKKARDYMNQEGADFIATGEVVGQRPMSQQRHIFNLMEKNLGLKDYILRPLSALLLPPTHPERVGMVDREKLHGISGRKRIQQFHLAKEYGLDDYPNPSGGCLLTDPNFSLRLKELLLYKVEVDIRDLRLLKVGRHFRLNDGTKIIVGRHQADNAHIMDLHTSADILIVPHDVEGPTVLIPDVTYSDDLVITGASFCMFYSDGKDRDKIRVIVKYGNEERIVDANLSYSSDIQKYMIKR